MYTTMAEAKTYARSRCSRNQPTEQGPTPCISMAMDPQTTLVAPLGDILDDFLHCELARVLHQAAELEAAMKLHQSRMKDVCHSIQAHYHCANYGGHFPEFDLQCRRCGDSISPEFAYGRHTGFCKQRERLVLEAGLYLPESSWD